MVALAAVALVGNTAWKDTEADNLLQTSIPMAAPVASTSNLHGLIQAKAVPVQVSRAQAMDWPMAKVKTWWPVARSLLLSSKTVRLSML